MNAKIPEIGESGFGPGASEVLTQVQTIRAGLSRLAALEGGALGDLRMVALLAALAPASSAEYTLRDSTDTACTAVAAPPAPTPVPTPHNIWDTDDARATLVKIKNSCRIGTDCAFTVELLDAHDAVVGSQALEPGQSTSLWRKGVKTVRIICAPAAAPARCKANYTLVVNHAPRWY